MSRIWQFQEAEGNFSEVIDKALSEGPQIIARNGIETAAVLSLSEYRQLAFGGKKLSEFFQESPLVGLDLDLRRDR